MGARKVRVAVYVNAEPWELRSRFKKLRAYAQVQPGWRVVAQFYDISTARHRKGRRMAVKAARHGQFDVLLVTALDRVTRHARELMTLASDLDDAHVALRSMAQPFDTSVPGNAMILPLLAILAEFELIRHAEASRAEKHLRHQRRRLRACKGRDH